MTNTGIALNAYAILIEDADWTVTASPALTEVLAVGEQAVVTITVEAPSNAEGQQIQPLISTRAEIDGGTRSWITITATATESAIPGDLNGDGTVDGADLLILLGAWGQCADPDDCPADLDGSGTVDGADLLILLGNWG